MQHSALLCGRFSLHLLGHLDVHLEELRDTAVQTDGLALVEFALAVGVGDALLGACVHEPVRTHMSAIAPAGQPQYQHILVEHVGDHLDLSLCCGNLLR